ncbi:MAG TPA: hypothetical protein VMB03_22045 [Bryobacteraceae bacterium]|nr:hypothetical protein [Bryobacteraceae bacterium]
MNGLSPRLAAAICLVLVLGGFLAFAVYLDRYPAPYFDEGAYNQPALRTLDGLSFAWPMAASAPYGKLVWAYHGPFYPRLQEVTFRVLGVSGFAARIPNLAAACLGILLLCGILIRAGYRWSAVLVAIAWLGDRSLVEALYGRMDGLTLLFLVCTLAAFTGWLASRGNGALFWTGLFAGTALGFHPSTLTTVIGIGAVVLFLARVGKRRQILYFAAGLAIPGAVWLAFLAPYFRESLVQFRWHLHHAKHVDFLGSLTHMISVLRWSRYWAVALMAVTLLLLLPTAAARLWKCRSEGRVAQPVVLAASLFAVCGLAVLFASPMWPYYLIPFSVWPVTAAVTMVETEGLRYKPALAAVALLAVGWLPSAAWNAMRWREARLFYPKMDPASFVERVRAVIPPNARFEVSPEFFILVRPIAHDAVKPPLSKPTDLPPDEWLVMSENELDQLGGEQAPGFRERKVLYSGLLFPGTAAGGTMTIFSPVQRTR